jgi:hypothetical protein
MTVSAAVRLMPKPPALVLKMKINMSDLEILSVAALEQKLKWGITAFANPSPYPDDLLALKSHPNVDICTDGRSNIPPSDPSFESFGNISKHGGLRPLALGAGCQDERASQSRKPSSSLQGLAFLALVSDHGRSWRSTLWMGGQEPNGCTETTAQRVHKERA